MNIFSPSEVTSYVKQLLAILNINEAPQFVPVKVEPSAKPGQCYYNVAEKVETAGGRIRYGWVIWQSELLCEAEHHAVWQSPGGALLCITPRNLPLDYIMFVIDDTKVYQGVSFDNVRINTADNPLVDDMITILAINEQLSLLGQRMDRYSIRLPRYVEQQILRNRQILHNLNLFVLQGGRPGSQCFCQQGKPFHQCHGQQLSKRAQEEFEMVQEFHKRLATE